MIRLKQVTIKNFRNFQGEYEFDFTKNITIFLGDNGNGKSSIFDAIQLERRKELAFENGDRWFTLKRLQGVAGISPVYTSGIQRSGNGYLANGTGTASSEQTLKAGDHKWQLPIPQSVLNLNKNMTQTPGY